jgi:hypothetical protein
LLRFDVLKRFEFVKRHDRKIENLLNEAKGCITMSAKKVLTILCACMWGGIFSIACSDEDSGSKGNDTSTDDTGNDTGTGGQGSDSVTSASEDTGPATEQMDTGSATIPQDTDSATMISDTDTETATVDSDSDSGTTSQDSDTPTEQSDTDTTVGTSDGLFELPECDAYTTEDLDSCNDTTPTTGEEVCDMAQCGVCTAYDTLRENCGRVDCTSDPYAAAVTCTQEYAVCVQALDCTGGVLATTPVASTCFATYAACVQ